MRWGKVGQSHTRPQTHPKFLKISQIRHKRIYLYPKHITLGMR